MKAQPEKTGTEEQPALFSSLLLRLAVETKAFLGEQVAPEVEPMEPNFEYAKHIIDTLQMLREKTEGNRTAAESEMLEAVLYDLRMSFLQSGGQGKVADKSEGRSQNSEVRTADPDAGQSTTGTTEGQVREQRPAK